MNYINIQGDENTIIQELSKYMNPGGAKLIVQNLPSYIDVLDDDETFEVKEEIEGLPNKGLGLLLLKTNYYLNVKKTTIAFIGLLFDIQFTKGFASFALEVFGITADTIRKLSEIEKCVLLLIKTDSIIIDDGKYALSGTPNCKNFALRCTYCQYDKCCLSKEVLNDTVQKLLDAKVIKCKGNSLVYCF
ncbi:MAG: hypothetical protein HDR00_05610 [Lachnospiraceae bacterium]|nr:hypothetical protein [Lachnospiraceae bacterium]